MALKVVREGESQPVRPELAHYFGVVGSATEAMTHSLFAGLGPDVLDAEDRAAMYPAPAPTPVFEAANNVIQFPQQPALGGVAITEQQGAMGPDVQVLAPAPAPQPLGDIAPVQEFPPIQPPFGQAA